MLAIVSAQCNWIKLYSAHRWHDDGVLDLRMIQGEINVSLLSKSVLWNSRIRRVQYKTIMCDPYYQFISKALRDGSA